MTSSSQVSYLKSSADEMDRPLARPRRRRWLWIGAGAAVAAGVVAGIVWMLPAAHSIAVKASETQVATVLTMITVDPDDPAFARPTKFVGPVYQQDAADTLAAKKGWAFRPDGTGWRRVVPSPEPRQILEIKPISWLLEHGTVVICAGGGGIPTVHPTSDPDALAGVEAVIDKDLASELLAEDVGADLFLMATDVDGVYLNWGTPEQRRLDRITPGELASHQFAAGSMGPKVEAAARFVAKTGHRAAIGSLADIPGIVAGTAGTNVIAQPS